MSQDHNPSTIYLGLDVAKSELVLDAARFGGLAKVKNTAAGHAKVIAALQTLQGPACLPHVVLEASGGYERPLTAALQAAGLRVSVVNPARVRFHALAKGTLAKTDDLDASLLSDFGEARKPAPTPALSANQQALAELTARRLQLIDLRTQEKNRTEHHQLSAVCAEAKDLQAVLDTHITRIEAELEALYRADVALAAKVERLCQVQGVGEITALGILASIPELGTLNRQQAAALAGLAPFARESGQWKGQRRIGGGRDQARRALYMAAFSASRFNPLLQPHFQQLRDRGKPFKVALCAVMRRLLVVFNSLLKDPSLTLLSGPSTQPRASSRKGTKKCSP